MSLPAGFFTLHRDLPREGPGSAVEVDWVLDRIPAPGRVLDLACGPGADTVTLAERLPEARIEAVDITPHFAAETRRRTAQDAHRVTVREGDMREVSGEWDLIWCMGALYAVGLEAALPIWRQVLAPGGVVAFSEPVFSQDPPGAGEAAFWADYPGCGSVASIEARIAAAGFRTVASRLMQGPPWAEYYLPMAARIEQLAPDASPDLAEVLEAGRREIALWRAAPDEVSYLLSIVEPA